MKEAGSKKIGLDAPHRRKELKKATQGNQFGSP